MGGTGWKHINMTKWTKHLMREYKRLKKKHPSMTLGEAMVIAKRSYKG
jgi:hypothetical protein